MFSYFRNGIKDTHPEKVIDLPELVGIIQNNPDKEKIERIRILKRNGDEGFRKLKEELSNITPNCIVKVRNLKGENFYRNFLQSSGYIYLDFDGITDITSFKEKFIKKYGNKVAMVCISSGGDGLSVLVKTSQVPSSKEHFNRIKKWIIDTILEDEDIDANASGIGRAMYISYDPDVYFNYQNEIDVNICSTTGLNEGLNQSISYNNPIWDETFSPINIADVFKNIRLRTGVDVENSIVDVIPVEYAEVRFPEVIPDGCKHRIYPGMIHSLVYLNPDVDPKYLLSYIWYINDTHAKPPMVKKELIRLFNFVYLSIINDPEYIYYRTKTKFVHFNKNSGLNGKKKRILASKLNGQRKRNESIERIMLAKEELISVGEKVTQKKISKLSGLALSTVKRHYRENIMDINEMVKVINSNPDTVLGMTENKVIPQDPLARWGGLRI